MGHGARIERKQAHVTAFKAQLLKTQMIALKKKRQ